MVHLEGTTLETEFVLAAEEKQGLSFHFPGFVFGDFKNLYLYLRKKKRSFQNYFFIQVVSQVSTQKLLMTKKHLWFFSYSKIPRF